MLVDDEQSTSEPCYWKSSELDSAIPLHACSRFSSSENRNCPATMRPLHGEDKNRLCRFHGLDPPPLEELRKSESLVCVSACNSSSRREKARNAAIVAISNPFILHEPVQFIDSIERSSIRSLKSIFPSYFIIISVFPFSLTIFNRIKSSVFFIPDKNCKIIYIRYFSKLAEKRRYNVSRAKPRSVTGAALLPVFSFSRGRLINERT